jgi:hypothetical protein
VFTLSQLKDFRAFVSKRQANVTVVRLCFTPTGVLRLRAVSHTFYFATVRTLYDFRF